MSDDTQTKPTGPHPHPRGDIEGHIQRRQDEKAKAEEAARQQQPDQKPDDKAQ